MPTRTDAPKTPVPLSNDDVRRLVQALDVLISVRFESKPPTSKQKTQAAGFKRLRAQLRDLTKPSKKVNE